MHAAHDTVGRQAAQLGIDVVVGVGDGGAVIADAAQTGGVQTSVVADAASASALVSRFARPGDVVLVKASNAVALGRVADDLVARGRARCASDGTA